MNCTQAKQIKIEGFLRSINIHPDKSRRAGTGTGGNILDLVMEIKQTDVPGALEYLASKSFEPFSFYQQKEPARMVQKKDWNRYK